MKDFGEPYCSQYYFNSLLTRPKRLEDQFHRGFMESNFLIEPLLLRAFGITGNTLQLHTVRFPVLYFYRQSFHYDFSLKIVNNSC